MLRIRRQWPAKGPLPRSEGPARIGGLSQNRRSRGRRDLMHSIRVAAFAPLLAGVMVACASQDGTSSEDHGVSAVQFQDVVVDKLLHGSGLAVGPFDELSIEIDPVPFEFEHFANARGGESLRP